MTRDWIELGAMKLSCRLGLAEPERSDPQPLQVELSMGLDLSRAASGDLGASVDYAEVLSEITCLATEGRWRILETLAAALCRHLLAPASLADARAGVDAVRVRLGKPEVFGGRAVPSIQIERDRAWYAERMCTTLVDRGVLQEALAETPETSAYHVTLQPATSCQVSGANAVRVLSGEIRCEAAEEPRRSHRLTNVGTQAGRALVVALDDACAIEPPEHPGGSMLPRPVSIRLARMADEPRLRTLIEQSAKALGGAHYTRAQIDAALGGAWGVDPQLISDRTYFVAETGDELVACGGWSRRATLFGADAQIDRQPALLDPLRDAARIRAFFVHPTWSRRGLGQALLDLSERAARAEGFRALQLMATLPGQRLYAAYGYESAAPLDHLLMNDLSIEFVPMHRRIA